MKTSTCIQSCLFALILGGGASAFATDKACEPAFTGGVPPTSETPRPELSLSWAAIKNILALLRGGYRWIGDMDGGYWDNMSRHYAQKGDFERLDQEYAQAERNPGRTYFFPRTELGRETRDFIDIEALGLGHNSKMATSARVENLIEGPYTDPIEIQTRQNAIKEFLLDNPRLLVRIKNIFGAGVSRKVLRDLHRNDREPRYTPDPFSQSIFLQAKEIWTQYPEALQGKEAPVGGIYIDMVKMISETNNTFFKDSLAVVRTLREANLQSHRLQQLLWVLDTIARDQSAGKWIHENASTSDMVKHHELQMRVDTRDQYVQRGSEYKDIPTHMYGRLKLYLEAYSELVMYFELAEHSLQRQWLTFPEILDPATTGRPVFAINNGHAPRWKEAYRDPTKAEGKVSVPNSVELGSNGFRHLVITGPNYQGKSTALRMIAQLMTLAQIGMPVPAEGMTLTPMNLLIYMHPKDDARNSESLYSAEISELWGHLYRAAARNPFQLIILDEIAPGTRQEVREATEETFLKFLDRAGVLTVEATHNNATTNLANPPGSTFSNMHVANFRLLPGANNDLTPMFQGATAVQQRALVPPEAIKMFQQLADQKIREQKEKQK